jgi:hypothetical protein
MIGLPYFGVRRQLDLHKVQAKLDVQTSVRMKRTDA